MLEDCLRAAFKDRTCQFWLPTLTQVLVRRAEAKMLDELGIDPVDYGTSRYLRRKAFGSRQVVASLEWPVSNPKALLIEELGTLDTESYQRLGLLIARAEGDRLRENLACIKTALQIISCDASMCETLASLVRVLHLLEAPNDSVDVSHSDPSVPFSAFISVPSKACAEGPLRVAEAIIHEGMHLQLSLIEAVTPLVTRTGQDVTLFSPWTKSERPLLGILHGIYVFGVIASFLNLLQSRQSVLDEQNTYAIRRRRQIARELTDFHGLASSTALTEIGRGLVQRALKEAPNFAGSEA